MGENRIELCVNGDPTHVRGSDRMDPEEYLTP